MDGKKLPYDWKSYLLIRGSGRFWERNTNQNTNYTGEVSSFHKPRGSYLFESYDDGGKHQSGDQKFPPARSVFNAWVASAQARPISRRPAARITRMFAFSPIRNRFSTRYLPVRCHLDTRYDLDPRPHTVAKYVAVDDDWLGSATSVNPGRFSSQSPTDRTVAHASSNITRNCSLSQGRESVYPRAVRKLSSKTSRSDEDLEGPEEEQVNHNRSTGREDTHRRHWSSPQLVDTFWWGATKASSKVGGTFKGASHKPLYTARAGDLGNPGARRLHHLQAAACSTSVNTASRAGSRRPEAVKTSEMDKNVNKSNPLDAQSLEVARQLMQTRKKLFQDTSRFDLGLTGPTKKSNQTTARKKNLVPYEPIFRPHHRKAATERVCIYYSSPRNVRPQSAENNITGDRNTIERFVAEGDPASCLRSLGYSPSLTGMRAGDDPGQAECRRPETPTGQGVQAGLSPQTKLSRHRRRCKSAMLAEKNNVTSNAASSPPSNIFKRKTRRRRIKSSRASCSDGVRRRTPRISKISESSGAIESDREQSANGAIKSDRPQSANGPIKFDRAQIANGAIKSDRAQSAKSNRVQSANGAIKHCRVQNPKSDKVQIANGAIKSDRVQSANSAIKSGRVPSAKTAVTKKSNSLVPTILRYDIRHDGNNTKSSSRVLNNDEALVGIEKNRNCSFDDCESLIRDKSATDLQNEHQIQAPKLFSTGNRTRRESTDRRKNFQSPLTETLLSGPLKKLEEARQKLRALLEAGKDHKSRQTTPVVVRAIHLPGTKDFPGSLPGDHIKSEERQGGLFPPQNNYDRFLWMDDPTIQSDADDIKETHSRYIARRKSNAFQGDVGECLKKSTALLESTVAVGEKPPPVAAPRTLLTPQIEKFPKIKAHSAIIHQPPYLWDKSDIRFKGASGISSAKNKFGCGVGRNISDHKTGFNCTDQGGNPPTTKTGFSDDTVVAQKASNSDGNRSAQPKVKSGESSEVKDMQASGDGDNTKAPQIAETPVAPSKKKRKIRRKKRRKYTFNQDVGTPTDDVRLKRRAGSGSKFCPKTYHQLGLAPLVRSPSSENTFHFSEDLGDTSHVVKPRKQRRKRKSRVASK